MKMLLTIVLLIAAFGAAPAIAVDFQYNNCMQRAASYHQRCIQRVASQHQSCIARAERSSVRRQPPPVLQRGDPCSDIRDKSEQRCETDRINEESRCEMDRVKREKQRRLNDARR